MKYFIAYKDEYNENIYRYDGRYYYFYHPVYKDWLHAGPSHMSMVQEDLFDISEEDAFLKVMELSA